MARTLYHFEACPHCETVRLALAIERLDYESAVIDPEDRTVVSRVSGQDKVPVLVEDDGKVLNDSNRILRHLAARPGSRLLPDGRRDQALTWVLVERADGVLGPLCRRESRQPEAGRDPSRENGLEALARTLDGELAVLEGILDRGPYLFGDHPTVADLALHAFIHRLHRMLDRSVPASFGRVAAWYRRIEEATRKTTAI